MGYEENTMSLEVGDCVAVGSHVMDASVRTDAREFGLVKRLMQHGVAVLKSDRLEYLFWYDELMLIARVKDYQGIIHIPDREG